MDLCSTTAFMGERNLFVAAAELRRGARATTASYSIFPLAPPKLRVCVHHQHDKLVLKKIFKYLGMMCVKCCTREPLMGLANGVKYEVGGCGCVELIAEWIGIN